ECVQRAQPPELCQPNRQRHFRPIWTNPEHSNATQQPVRQLPGSGGIRPSPAADGEVQVLNLLDNSSGKGGLKRVRPFFVSGPIILLNLGPLVANVEALREMFPGHARLWAQPCVGCYCAKCGWCADFCANTRGGADCNSGFVERCA